MEFTPEIKKATQPIYQKISKTIPEIEWSTHAPYIYEINKLKKKKNAVILAIIIRHQKYIMEYQIFLRTLLPWLLRLQKLKLI